MDDQLEERVAALVRAVTDGEGDAAALAEAAVTAERLEDCEAAVEDLEDRVAELEAATQALRGYVGEVRSVNREVEERADLALSRVEALSGRAGTGEEATAQAQAETDSERTRQADPSHGGEQRLPGDRCDRCGRPRAAGDGTDASDDRPGTASGPGGFGSGPPDGRVEPAWDGTGASGQTGDGARAGDSPEGGGPIDRLRQLL